VDFIALSDVLKCVVTQRYRFQIFGYSMGNEWFKLPTIWPNPRDDSLRVRPLLFYYCVRQST